MKSVVGLLSFGSLLFLLTGCLGTNEDSFALMGQRDDNSNISTQPFLQSGQDANGNGNVAPANVPDDSSSPGSPTANQDNSPPAGNSAGPVVVVGSSSSGGSSSASSSSNGGSSGSSASNSSGSASASSGSTPVSSSSSSSNGSAVAGSGSGSASSTSSSSSSSGNSGSASSSSSSSSSGNNGPVAYANANSSSSSSSGGASSSSNTSGSESTDANQVSEVMSDNDPGCSAGGPIVFPPKGTPLPEEEGTGFDMNNFEGGSWTISSNGTTVDTTLQFDVATYVAPDGITITGELLDGTIYTLFQTCRLRTAPYADPTGGKVRPPEDSIRQYLALMKAGTVRLTFDFTKALTPTYIRVIGLGEFTLVPAPVPHAYQWRLYPAPTAADMAGSLVVLGNSAPNLTLSGNAQVEGKVFDNSLGNGIQFNGNGTISGEQVQAGISDPYAGQSPGQNLRTQTISKITGSQNLPAGIYPAEVDISGNANVTLDGVYVLQKGLKVSGNAVVSGAAVIYAPNASIQLSGNAQVSVGQVVANTVSDSGGSTLATGQ